MRNGGSGLRRKTAAQPKSRLLAPAFAASAAAFVAALVVAVGRAFGLLITFTDSSAPAGIYRAVSGSAGRGELVAACLPKSAARLGLTRGYLTEGDCPGGAEPVAKLAEAFARDVVDVEPDWVAVNGARFADSRTAAHDSAGRSLRHVPWGRREVRPGEVWLFGFNDARSWDARYFGPVPLVNVRGVLKPVLTW